jgi:hypothetical protein
LRRSSPRGSGGAPAAAAQARGETGRRSPVARGSCAAAPAAAHPRRGRTTPVVAILLLLPPPFSSIPAPILAAGRVHLFAPCPPSRYLANAATPPLPLAPLRIDLAKEAWREGRFGARRRVRWIPDADSSALARRGSSPQEASRGGRMAREIARWKFTDSVGLLENDLKELL